MSNSTTNILCHCFSLVVLCISLLSNADEFNFSERVFDNVDSQYTNALATNDTLPVNARIIALLTLSEHDKVTGQLKLAQLVQISAGFNVAEKYLMMVIRAHIVNIKGQENKVINWLNKAIKLESQIVKKQLDSPVFAKSHQLLSRVYKESKQFKKAFDSQQVYMKKHLDYLAEQKTVRIKRLDEKYQMNTKHKENELLEQTNQLKQLALQDVQEKKRSQYRNIVIVICTGIIFFLLLLRQIKIRRLLKYLAKTDSLTSLVNRRTLFTRGQKLVERAITTQSTLSTLMIDIDYFKAINDDYGHDVGDQVIKTIANLGNETMRSRDLLSRLGGEEFAAILPGASIAEARAIAVHLLEKVAQYSFTSLGINRPITVSIGIANLTDVCADFDSLLHAADVAMYQAKAKGRNQIINFIPNSDNSAI